jgi:hypothetical protein
MDNNKCTQPFLHFYRAEIQERPQTDEPYKSTGLRVVHRADRQKCQDNRPRYRLVFIQLRQFRDILIGDLQNDKSKTIKYTTTQAALT